MKFKTIHLVIVFATLVGLIFILKAVKSNKPQGTLKTEFFEINQEEINKFVILPMHDESRKLEVVKENDKWFVVLDNGMKAETDQKFITTCLNEVQKLKPSSLKSKNQEKWPEFAVDSLGTLLQIFQEENIFEIIIGEMLWIDDNQIGSYVRLPNEVETYIVEAYLEGTIKSELTKWRNKSLVSMPAAAWQKLSFRDNTGSSSLLDKSSGSWMINNIAADSAAVASTIQAIEKLPTQGFADIGLLPNISTPTFSLNISSEENQAPSTINFFLVNTNWITNSTMNEGNYFNTDSTTINTIKSLFED